MNWPANTPQSPDDVAAGIVVTEDFERFEQRNDVFTRAFWDERIRSKQTDAFFNSYRMEAAPRRGEGFNQRDFALRNASWLISDIISDRGGDEGKREGFPMKQPRVLTLIGSPVTEQPEKRQLHKHLFPEEVAKAGQEAH